MPVLPAVLRSRRAQRTARLLVGLLALMTLAAASLYVLTPSVTDAPARVRRIDRAHHTSPVAVCRCSRLARALVAVEDERFYEHGAIDPLSIARVIKESIFGSQDPAGSTITQQLAKVLYVSDPGSLLGKLNAIALAVKLERRYSKAQILDMYLSAVYFGHGFYGARSASIGYFNRSISQLSWGQAALLAGLPQAPTAYDPLRHLALARQRQDEVLLQLIDNRALTKAGAANASQSALHLRSADKTFTHPVTQRRTTS